MVITYFLLPKLWAGVVEHLGQFSISTCLSAGSIFGQRQQAPRLAVNGEMRLNDEHPLHPRSAWPGLAGPAHISEYWPWVEHRVREAYVHSRYEALSGMPDVFMDLALADGVQLDGSTINDLQIRRDLVGQEVVESLPARTVFSAGLLAALPALRKAVRALNQTFDSELWMGRPVSDFMSEYVVAADPETTAIIAGMAELKAEKPPIEITLAALWNAVPEAPGAWRLENGTVLKLLPVGAAEGAHDAGGELATA